MASTVTNPSYPTTEIDELTPDFRATWNSTAGLDAVHAQVRILRPFVGSVIRQGLPAGFAHVQDGGQIEVLWSNLSFADLQWGMTYAWQMRGKDSNGDWSPWSESLGFATNVAPTIPSHFTPGGGTTVTSLPLVTCKCQDLGLRPVEPTVTLLIRQPPAIVARVRTMSSIGNNTFAYQTVSNDLPSPGNYGVSAYSYDGVLYSGTALTSGDAEISGEVVFTYAVIPTVTIVSPNNGDTIMTNDVQIDWVENVPHQSRRIVIYNSDNSVFQDSGVLPRAATIVGFVDMPFVDGASYHATVTITDMNGIQATSAPVTFTVNLSPMPTLGGFSVVPVKLGYDDMPTAIKVSWSASGSASFRQYRIWRQPVLSNGGIATGPWVQIGTVTNQSQQNWIDAECANNQWHRYGVTQQGAGFTDSPITTDDARVTFDGVTLGLVTDPEGFHARLRFGGVSTQQGTINWTSDKKLIQTYGGSLPIAGGGNNDSWNPSGSYLVVGDRDIDGSDGITAESRYMAIEDIVRNGGTVCWRDYRGRVAYVSIRRVNIIYREHGRYLIRVTAAQVARDIDDLVE